MNHLTSLQPPGWPRPKGYANGIVAEGRLVFISGQVGWTEEGVFESDDFVDQFRQVLKNTLTILAQAGGRAEHIARMTWYITDKAAYVSRLKEIGAAYRDIMGAHYPAMAVVEVTALVEDRAKIEIESTAVLPTDPASP